MQTRGEAGSQDRAGIRTILICALSNNLALGLGFGSFGPLLAANEAALGVDRASISLGMSAVTTALGLSSMILGGPSRRFAPGTTMAAGIGACAIGYAAIGLTDDYLTTLMMYAVIGFGIALAAILGPVTAVATHFPDRAGRVLGLVNLPLVLFIAPWVIARVLPDIGRSNVYLSMAMLLILFLPLLLLLPKPGKAQVGEGSGLPSTPTRAVIARADFWLVTIGIGVIAGTGTAYTVHAIPFAASRGMEPGSAAMMLSIYSGAGLAGTLLLGFLADRVGAPLVLAFSAAVQASCWIGLAVSPNAALLALAIVLGIAGVPLTALHGAAMTRMFGIAGVGRAMGLGYAIKLPFLFAVTPAVGWAFDRAMRYEPAFLVLAGGLAMAALLLAIGAMKSASDSARSMPA